MLGCTAFKLRRGIFRTIDQTSSTQIWLNYRFWTTSYCSPFPKKKTLYLTIKITAVSAIAFFTRTHINLDILTAVKRTVIPKPHDLGFCFFPLRGFAPALTDLLCSGLMVALQTDTASPAAKIFLLALISRSWCVPQSGQSHSRTFNGIFSAIYPQLLHLLELGNHLSISR